MCVFNPKSKIHIFTEITRLHREIKATSLPGVIVKLGKTTAESLRPYPAPLLSNAVKNMHSLSAHQPRRRRCSRRARRRNEYRNNVSMGMTQWSFYLSNLRRISEIGVRRNGKSGGRNGDAEREAEEKRGAPKASASPTMEIRFIVLGPLPAFATCGP